VLFPYVRDTISTRFLMLHNGQRNSGKTSAAENANLFHGMGEVDGDVTAAALGNQLEQGFAVLDNKEHKDFKPELINHCLFSATGGKQGRKGPTQRSKGCNGIDFH
jgi:hypothetical protein